MRAMFWYMGKFFTARVVCEHVMTYMYIIFVDIKKLHDKETWSVDADDERGGVTVLVGTILLICCNKTCYLVERNVSDA